MIGFTSNNPQLPMSNLTMKKFCILPLIAALAFFVSCQKQQTEEEKKAEVERQVQERLATERQADEKQRLAQQQADLEAREKALADKETAPAATPSVPQVEPVTREQTETRSETRSETTATYGLFYEKLEPYGAWRETADYGYVYQPRVAEESQEWRPYTDGRWAYSDAGWTWISDEPFGWATYHYGRWLRLRRVGWVWVPGDEWAPAWVSWRTSKDYVGWAPLPPEARFDRRSGIHNWADSYYDIGPDQYAFVPGNEFGSQHVRRSVVPAERNITLVNETTNVTNITYANTTIMNQGPNYEEMRSRSQQPMERYRLRRHAEVNSDSAAATVRGDEIVITVPLLNNIPGFHRPRTVRERVSEVVIDNGWTAVADRSAAERTRAKMKAEATAPPNVPPKKFVKPRETSTAATPATTPTATAAISASPTPTVATVAATSPTPAAASPTPPAQATASASPVASPSASVRTRPSPSPLASASPAPSATAVRQSSPTPAASIAPAATPSPMASVSPTVRTRPSPPALRPSPSIASSPAASVSTPPEQIRRHIPPLPVNTPAAVATPATTPPVTTPPPVRKPTMPPAVTQPVATPAATPPRAETSAPTPTVPKRMVPRPTPPVSESSPAATAPNVPPASSPTPANDDKVKNKKPKRPGPVEGETPTPAPSTVPN
ncbi:MAG: hypothetical protein QOF24_2075 [Verrucomicrobiota bacterium]|jgi:hypothetical protein